MSGALAAAGGLAAHPGLLTALTGPGSLTGLEPWQLLVVVLAGFWAGTINSIIGSGTLVTFPVLVAVGYPPVVAQVSNAMGLTAAGVSGALGYRRELAESRALVPRLTLASLLGSIIGATLLTVLPPVVFGYVAPMLLVTALTVVVLQPRIQAAVRRRAQAAHDAGRADPREDSSVPVGPVTPTLWALVFLAGIYGGYFVAAQGVMLMAIFGVLMVGGTLVHANAVKTWLALTVNLTAAVYYLLFAADRIDWHAVLILAASSLVGGTVGARIGRRISPTALRVVIVVVGLAGLVSMILRLVDGG